MLAKHFLSSTKIFTIFHIPTSWNELYIIPWQLTHQEVNYYHIGSWGSSYPFVIFMKSRLESMIMGKNCRCRYVLLCFSLSNICYISAYIHKPTCFSSQCYISNAIMEQLQILTSTFPTIVFPLLIACISKQRSIEMQCKCS